MTLTARDVMTTQVVTLTPTLRLSRAAEILANAGISAAPVLDAANHLVGMCSEGDLMHGTQLVPGGTRSWWLDVLAEGENLSPEFLAYVRGDDRTVADVMQPNVVGVSETTTLPEIAAILDRHHFKRVPILREGHLVGIVSRADLVRALAKDSQALLF